MGMERSKLLMNDKVLSIKNSEFFLGDKPYNIYSGAMHYFRIVPEYWEDRLTKLKLAGFNTVETYVCWNLHEKKSGVFDFSGILDIEKYIKTAQKIGLNVIVRPGPYICAEWDFGGLPAWLLKDKNMRLRCFHKPYLDAVERFYDELFPRLKPLLASNGGPIIAMQVENEYGSYSNDKKYLNYVKSLFEKHNMDVLLFTSDGNLDSMLSGGSIDGVLKTLNFGSGSRTAFNVLKKYGEKSPKMCMEFWCGWFDHWGYKHHTRSSAQTEYEIKGFLSQNASFNIYMFHGGTNFGFTSGANYTKRYLPTVTSYDYCALLNEYGDYTPAYHKVRKLLHEKQNLPLQELPESPKLQNIGEIELTESTSLFSNLENIAEKHYSPTAESMEYFDQNFGMIYYKTKIKGKYPTVKYTVSDVHDRAFVYVDGKKTATIDRTLENKKRLFKSLYSNTFTVSPISSECEIGVLVDAMGRVNYGQKLYDRKGISAISSSVQVLCDYEIYTIPLDNLEKLDWTQNSDKYPIFFKGNFDAEKGKDCFVETKGFTKGNVWINGFNLGRYWSKGPQKTLYLPAPLLKEKDNEIIVLELENADKKSIKIIDKHKLF